VHFRLRFIENDEIRKPATLKPQFGRPFSHRINAEPDVRVEFDSQLSRALNHVLPIDSPREGFVLHLFAHAGHFDICNGLGRLDQGAGCEEAGQLVAGEEDLSRCVTRGTPEYCA